MKFSWSACLFVASVARAQYFSAGWQPGQQRAAPTAVPIQVDSTFEASGSENAPESAPQRKVISHQPVQAAKPDIWALFDINTYLKTDTSKQLFQSFGINITEKLEAAAETPWDKRIPLLTDSNFQDMIVNEPISDEAAADRVWVICVSATSGRQDGISRFVDEAFDDAFNRSLIADDLHHVRWSRIDYFNVTYLTTKWVIWQAPYVVIAKDRGQSLYFYKPSSLRMRDGAIRDFLLEDGWKATPVWATAYAPGGEREYIMEFIAVWMTKIYNFFVRVPKFILLMASGTVASFMIGFMHKSPAEDKTKKTKPAAETPAVAPAPAKAPAASTSATASPSKSSKRKGKK